MRGFLYLLSATAVCLAQPASDAQLSQTLKDLANRCNHAVSYSWSGNVTLDRRVGQGLFVEVALAHIELAGGENGKSMLKLRSPNGDSYWLISDGNKTWSYLPSKKQYMEEEAASLSSGESGDDIEEGTAPERAAREAVANVARFVRQAQSLSHSKEMPAKFAGEKVRWPVIDIQEKPEEDGSQTIAELVMAPDRPALARLVWVTIHGGKASRVNIEFDSFSVGQPVADDQFVFDPPKKARLVDTLEIPGQPGSVLLNHPSPDFEEKTLSGEKVKLSSLRGQVVMLDFWASWCPPCREELPVVAKLAAEFKGKGVAVYGVNDEDGRIARKYLEKAGLDLATLDDSADKAHRLYRVDAIPTVFLIGPDGTVLKWFRGGRSEQTLRAAVQSAGVAK